MIKGTEINNKRVKQRNQTIYEHTEVCHRGLKSTNKSYPLLSNTDLGQRKLSGLAA